MSSRAAAVSVDDLAADFGQAMAGLAPFEAHPHLAVAVSGGADSTALAILARDWAHARGGRVTALIVDHRLRPESHHEAALVAEQMTVAGIAPVILDWQADKPLSGIQATARAARYALLGDWCRGHGVLHLLVGHHADDQDETVAMRQARGEGPGAAGMSTVVEKRGYRLLRPLLSMRKTGLQRFLCLGGHPWVEDPSNEDPRFERVRVRQVLQAMPAIPDRQRRAATVRIRMEAAVGALLAETAMLHPLGFATLCTEKTAQAPLAVGATALGALIAWTGGLAHPPGQEALRRSWRAAHGLAPGKSLTLGRCLVRRRQDELVVMREARGLPAPLPLTADLAVKWDGRFDVACHGTPSIGSWLDPLGAEPEALRRFKQASPAARGVPHQALATLPAVWSAQGLLCVPGLEAGESADSQFSAVFRPRRSLLSPTFAVA